MIVALLNSGIKAHQVYIDSLKFYSDFLITNKNKKNQKGFETYIHIKDISKGKHLLELKRIRLREKEKDTIQVTDIGIPF